MMNSKKGKKIVERELAKHCLPAIQIDKNTSLDKLISLREGQSVEDENGRVGILLSLEIKAYRTETHIYLKLSSSPKMILIIK